MPALTPDRPASLHDTLEALERASDTPTKQRRVNVSSLVHVVCRHAFDVGLDRDHLRTVVQIASVKTELDQTSVTTLIKNLYPAQRVPADVVVTIVGALGQGKGKPAPTTQNGFVKWLITVHDIIEDPNILSRLYGVLFGMLDSISIRTSLCHLLSLITRRKHVKPFRIQQLLELARGLGNEPALQGLLRIYKDYYPDIILGSTSVSRSSFPPQPDSEWRSRILAIQERAAAENEAGFEQQNGFKVLRKGHKRVKTSAIPDVHTFHANETSVTLEGIDNVEDFVEKLDKIEPPGQLVSFLTDPLLQKYVELQDSPIISRRIQLWLSTCLEDLYNSTKDGTVDERYLTEILEGLLKHAQYTKKLLPIVQSFLKEYLLIWDGVQDVDTILAFLSYLPIQPFEEACATFLHPAERALPQHSTESYTRLLIFYTSLLRYWTNTATPQPNRISLALAHPDQLALHTLANHVSSLSTSLLLSASPSTSLTSHILTFYEHLSTTSIPHHIPITLPPPPLLYLLLLAPTSTTLARATAVIANYKRAFDAYPARLSSHYPAPIIEAFNAQLKDVFRMLWSSRAFADEGTLTLATPSSSAQGDLATYYAPTLSALLTAHLTRLDPTSYALTTSHNLSHHPALTHLTHLVWCATEAAEIAARAYDPDSIERHAGPVGQGSLERLRAMGGVEVGWEAFRVQVVRWCRERGLGGLGEFVWAAAGGMGRKYGEL